MVILSDSPPEKDIQWSDIGVISANKFLQKLWNLNLVIINRKEPENDNVITKKFNSEIELMVAKIDKSINEFKFNVSIALFYETYKIFNKFLETNINKKTFVNNLTKIMKLLIPFVPHLANECLDLLGCENRNEWPNIKTDLDNNIKFAVQINGKTRDIISIKKDLKEEDIWNLMTKNAKISRFFKDKEIIKKIFVKNKIINYIIK